MELDRIILAIIGFSTSFFLCVPNLKRWHKQKIAAEKLRIINEALEQAEYRVVSFQERHDRILNHICSSYLTNTELVEALAGARAAMNEALEFAVDLRIIKMKIISSFPDEIDVGMLDRSN
ncbi:ATP-dependent DNA helicase [Quillaja saponaria]|uniref:ATP-dependent DNA helicase n=1 Tax=Quillaja saponaria TaxID=32244 RepID=A0AAD7VJD2_QUISA|nr:ATP-dependent DNA helicase [Quillaja saponaria]